MFKKNDVLKLCQPGDILLTSNPAGIGKLINFGQEVEGKNDKSKYGHVAIFARKPESIFDVDGSIYESVMRISKNHIDKYSGKEICIIRHTGITKENFLIGRKEILDNLGQIYPGHRLLFHGLDMINSWIKREIFRRKAPLKFRYMRFMPLDWPVCSELGAQFIHKAGLEGGWEAYKKGWRGINPDDFDDCRIKRQDLWQTILEGEYRIN